MWQALKPDTGSECPQDNGVHFVCVALAALENPAEGKHKGMA